MMFPLVRELADDGIPVTVSCRVLKLARAAYYRWLNTPFTDGQLDEAWLANAIFDGADAILCYADGGGGRTALWPDVYPLA